jgi:peptide/nickel transport system permease protein
VNTSDNRNPRHRLLRLILLGTLIVCFVVLSVARWELLISSVVSLCLTPVAIVASGFDIARYWHVDLLEYWLAALVWCGIFLILLVELVNTLRARGEHPRENPGQESGRSVLSPGSFNQILLAAIIAVGLLAPFIAPFDPAAQGDLRNTRLKKPLEKALVFVPEKMVAERQAGDLLSFTERLKAKLLERNEKFSGETPANGSGSLFTGRRQMFFLGTDDLGRDVLSRVIYGMRLSLFIGFAGMLSSVFLGCSVGFVAGAFSGWLDKILMRMTDLFLAIPSLFLVITLVALLGNSTFLLIAVLAAAGWMNVARLVRAEVLVLRDREFILAARLLGRSSGQILRDHMIPNVLPTIIVASVLQLGNVILVEASLSFLGLGIQPPTPSLGNMIGESMAYIGSGWWVGIFPGIVLSGMLITVNIMAENLEKRVFTRNDQLPV